MTFTANRKGDKTMLTVHARCPNTVTNRPQAQKRFNEKGVALWLRACGKKAVLFYRDSAGKQRQKTFKVGRVVF